MENDAKAVAKLVAMLRKTLDRLEGRPGRGQQIEFIGYPEVDPDHAVAAILATIETWAGGQARPGPVIARNPLPDAISAS